MTLAEHAEAWTREQGKPVPPRDTPEWGDMYADWHEWAFQDFQDIKEKHKGKENVSTG